MTSFTELVAVAWQGLCARKLRSMMVIIGPLLGVGAIVGAVGLSESATGAVRQTLKDLGADLIVVDASPTPQDVGGPKLPAEAAQRALTVRTVVAATQATRLENLAITSTPLIGTRASTSGAFELWGTDAELASVGGLKMSSGRFINEFDVTTKAQVAVLGRAAGDAYGIRPGQTQSVSIGGRLFGVVGVLSSSTLLPELDRSVLIPTPSAVSAFGRDGRPTRLLLQVAPASTAATARSLPAVVTYGGPGRPSVRIPTDLLEARSAIDATLRTTVLAMGALALLVGGVGIANVLSMSVLERGTEIGVRRALGHTRSRVAMQFLLESLVIGAAGGVLGSLAGGVFVLTTAARRGWVPVVSPTIMVLAVLLAVLIAGIAGIYPALKAARLDPMEALRLH